MADKRQELQLQLAFELDFLLHQHLLLPRLLHLAQQPHEKQCYVFANISYQFEEVQLPLDVVDGAEVEVEVVSSVLELLVELLYAHRVFGVQVFAFALLMY